ncbi:hypothetical protein IHQ71_30850 (plasmid) [Rhizobium sp. TH2]|uniref:hypothetical protein n=1 Tax=Rhizobium sp. TH2 TaxID=2775403 RepID=UPI002157B7DA|nr:hypothetical protein [Rhizobium sp. TH2]UVC12403.1 hypothetical protein IHQ71_30850 [Rhizobium sp. TH2]
MLPIAPPLLPKSHPNRRLSCIASLRANFEASANGLVEAAVDEGWSRRETLRAIHELRTRKLA